MSYEKISDKYLRQILFNQLKCNILVTSALQELKYLVVEVKEDSRLHKK